MSSYVGLVFFSNYVAVKFSGLVGLHDLGGLRGRPYIFHDLFAFRNPNAPNWEYIGNFRIPKFACKVS